MLLTSNDSSFATIEPIWSPQALNKSDHLKLKIIFSVRTTLSQGKISHLAESSTLFHWLFDDME